MDKRIPYVIFTTALTGNALALPPTANNDNASTKEGEAVDIFVLDNDMAAEEGDTLRIVEAGGAEHGSLTINPDGSITYEPVADYTGPDTFAYKIESVPEYGGPLLMLAEGDIVGEGDIPTEGEYAIGTVTVTVEAADGPIDRETKSLESGVKGSTNKRVAASLDTACGELGLSDASNELVDRCDALSEIAASNPERLDDIMTQIAPEEFLALKRVTTDSARTQMDIINQHMQQRRSGSGPVAVSFNGYDLPVTGGTAGDTGSPEFGLFASANYSDVERDATTLEAGYDYSATGLTVGIDRRFTSAILAGLAVGWNNHELDYADNAGSTDSDLYSVILFSTADWKGVNFNLQLGTERGSFDTRRHISYQEPGGDFEANILGDTDATQYFTSVQVNYPVHMNALELTPYLRADYVSVEIDAFEESGGQGYELAIDKQKLNQYTFKAGLDASYAISQDWGVLVPYAGVSVVNETTGNYGSVSFVFINDPSKQSFELGSEGEESLFYQLRLGTSAVLTKGWSVFGDYSQILGYEDTTAYQVNVGLRYEL
ncbi:autotransporter outer membrane beta-barrel domain-containing protein [Hahella sp. CCB-MM4]|uniref:autotransporter domain-containing protein n=1 Tax=Hahella sp. (strain CCB-MM4) TaxID=1926491 RepID=UPI000B9BB9E1|nr:autotransporter domain-containing protein [Hahella sp. CCB-MM4]OZG70964.1 autotransporter outer membrane beta-barrel domain-containing protein [Hahella sp. CCB-MM4]